MALLGHVVRSSVRKTIPIYDDLIDFPKRAFHLLGAAIGVTPLS